MIRLFQTNSRETIWGQKFQNHSK